MIEQPGDNARIVRRVFRTDIIAFFQIWRRARLERLALQRLVTAIGIRARFVDQRFLLGRQSKERGGFAEDALDQRLLDAMIFDVEKTLVEAGGTQARPHRAPRIEVAACQVRNINNRKRRERQARGFERSRH